MNKKDIDKILQALNRVVGQTLTNECKHIYFETKTYWIVETITGRHEAMQS